MKDTVPLTITPGAYGQPAILDCSTFQGHLDQFEDAMAATWSAEFPGSTIEQLGIKAKADGGFERHWAACIALGYAAGAKASRIEAAIAAARVAATAAAAPKAAATFQDMVKTEIRGGRSKSEAVKLVACANPEAHALYVRTGGGQL